MKSSKKLEFSKMVKAYLDGRATPQQVIDLEQYYELFSAVPDILDNSDPLAEINIHDRMKAIINERMEMEVKPVSVFQLYQKYAVAAVILMIVSIGLFVYKHVDIPIINNTTAKADLLPGSNKAILILANGSKISLSAAKDGKIAEQFGTNLQKTKNGQLIYNNVQHKEEAKLAFNTIQIPKGGQYQLILPDGTKVWLNAASSLRYPIAFQGRGRKVELTGEAYFEVTKNKDMPFKVLSNQQEVEVLGTHFNINAYADEKVTKTSLLEGSVRVRSLVSGDKITIKPGEQSLLRENTDRTKLTSSPIDIDEAVAWKNGYFMFENETLESILRKVARWYDVDIQYQSDGLNTQLFSGTISKYSNASQVLKKLELTESVHFKINGRRIMVMK